MKVFFRNIHLYLSLAAGLVIMSCCFSGAVLVFEKELQEAFNHDRYYVKQQEVQLPIEKLTAKVKHQYPAAKVTGVKIYANALRSAEISVVIPEKAGRGIDEKRQPTLKEPQQQRQAAAGGRRPGQTVFVNPYNSQVLALYNYRKTFFYTMFSLHRWLLGNDSGIGKTITGIATFIFLFIIITGIILWWPRNKAILMQRLKIKTSAKFKRLNHDLHIVLGFYSAIFLFIFAFTALAWSFKWFNDGIYSVTGSSMKPSEPPHSVFQAGKKSINYDSAFITVSKAVPDVQYYILRAPEDSAAVFSVSVLPLGAHEGAADNYYIDQYTGNIVGSLKYKDKNLGQRVRATFKPVHVGSVFGLPSKLIAFIVCVFGVTFPVTGTIMWLNRLKKKSKAKDVNVVEEAGIN